MKVRVSLTTAMLEKLLFNPNKSLIFKIEDMEIEVTIKSAREEKYDYKKIFSDIFTSMKK